MLEREILKIDYGVSYGSSTLKSLQNDNVPELDLLVREAIQNSSDASLKEPGKSFSVNFTTGIFKPYKFNYYITDLESYLNSRFPADIAHFLEIRDTQTSGLTGCTRKAEIKREDHGNFFKLIYDSGKNQTQEGAGGNWGYGKSVYYRVGIGIVIFYSRIKTRDGYESRLIVTLVENEEKKDQNGKDATILNQLEPNSAGKAWWGIRDGEDLLPITDDDFINPVLAAFGLKPFKANETGTSIIIPYINPKKLLGDIVPTDAELEDGVKDHFTTVWTSRLDDYLRLAIQRWYAPKIHNRELTKISGCDKKWLLVSVNNKSIRKQDMLPFFRLVQELYTVAIAKTYGSAYKSEWLTQVECLPINIRYYFDGGMTAGYVAAVKISKDQLNGDTNALSPYMYIGKFESNGRLNEPVVMFARDPGMVIDYAVTGPWVKNITPPENDNEYIFAFFMPVTSKRLKDNLPAPEYAGMRLGEYLRKCEASDHMGWDDPARMQIVSRIQANTVNQVNGRINKGSDSAVSATASKLSSKLGRSLLPRIGYAKKPKGGNGGGGGGSGGKMKNIDCEILYNFISGDELTILLKLKLAHNKKNANIELIVASEGGWISPTAWQSDIGTNFPATIRSFVIRTIASNIDPEAITIDDGCTDTTPQFNSEKVSAALLCAEDSREFTTLRLDAHMQNMELIGVLKIKAYDKKYRFSIKVE